MMISSFLTTRIVAFHVLFAFLLVLGNGWAAEYETCQDMAPLPMPTDGQIALDHTLENVGDFSWYTFTVPEDGLYDWSFYFNDEVDIDIYLYGPFDDTAAAVAGCDGPDDMHSIEIESSESATATTEMVSVAEASAGEVYVLKVEFYDDGPLTFLEYNYRVLLPCSAMAPLNPVLTFGQIALDHDMLYVDDYSWYTITIPEDGTYDWSFYFNDEADVDVYLYGPFDDTAAAVLDCDGPDDMLSSEIDSSEGVTSTEVVSVAGASAGEVYVLKVEFYDDGPLTFLKYSSSPEGTDMPSSMPSSMPTTKSGKSPTIVSTKAPTQTKAPKAKKATKAPANIRK